MNTTSNGTASPGSPGAPSPNKDVSQPASPTTSCESPRIMPIPPDGGYGWVIVVASFFSNAIVDGTCSIFALLLPSLLAHYDGSRGQTTLAGSLLIGSFLMFGPFSGAILNRFGCRVTSMVGALILTTALIASTFAPNLTIFILIYGALGGVGLGLVYMPATVMVGYYFEKKRALATGIATSGAGVGMILFSLIAATCLEHYDWKNALILLSGLCLQALVLGALMRPLEENQSHPIKEITNEEGDGTGEESHLLFCGCCGTDFKRSSCTCQLLNSPQMSITEKGIVKSPHNKSKNLPLEHQVNGSACDLLTSNCSMIKACEAGKCRRCNRKGSLSLVRDHNYSQSCGALNSHHTSNMKKAIYTGSMRDHRPEVTQTQDARLEPQKVIFCKPLIRDDIFYSGSIHQLPEYMSCPDRDTYIASFTSLPHQSDEPAYEESHQSCCFSRVFAAIKNSDLFDSELITSSSFLVIAFGNFLCHIAMHIPMVFIADYAISLDITPKMAASLMTAIGVCTTIGRAAAGAAADLKYVGAHIMTSLSFIIAGIATILCVHTCRQYETLLVFAVVYGLALAVFVPLTTVLLVQYVGLHKLTSAYGLLSLIKGVACFLGPPIAGGKLTNGSILDKTASYGSAFYLAGGLFLASAVVFLAIPLAHRRQSPRPQPTLIRDVHDSSEQNA